MISVKKLLVYRASFLISLALMSMWVGAYATLIEVIFYHTDTLAGWNKGSVMLVMAYYYLIQNISDIFFKENFEHFGEVMRRGDLDFRIVKPAPVRLLVFFWEIRFDHAAGLIPTGLLFFYAFKNLPEALSFSSFLLGLLASAASVILYFSILSFIATLTFWIERNDTFNTLIFNVSQLSRYPRQIYRNTVGKLLTFGIPVALIASIPAETALKFESGSVFFLFSRLFWHYGLRRYTSAT
ncbi:ABC-2 family transporter protein [Candidatus Peregrinibacteria bacterium]|nr:ABC-2 family transporter protein [Candidatus Peregrinibacteria bacterium]